jgi:hypothetical protein
MSATIASMDMPAAPPWPIISCADGALSLPAISRLTWSAGISPVATAGWPGSAIGSQTWEGTDWPAQ